MKTKTLKLVALLISAMMALGPAIAAADNGRGRGHDKDRKWEEKRDRRDWNYERNRGWRYEVRPGYWSPYYVWWWLDGRTVMRVAPTRTVIAYRNGQYELRGDGYRVPYYWVWIPAIPAPPPLPPEVGEYPGPPDAPPPPPGTPQAPPQPNGDKDVAGMVIGGVVGGVLGSTVHGKGRTAGIIIGSILGAVIGHQIGRSLDEADELRAAYALEKNKTGEKSTWVNPDTGYEVSVTPQKTYKNDSGEYCREFQTEITVGGKKEQAYGKACRQPDGQWKIIQ